MQLEIASFTSYPPESKARSRAGGYHLLSNKLPERPIQPGDQLPMNNGPVCVHCSIMPILVRSAVEAGTGGGYCNGIAAVPLRTAPEEIGHPQLATPMECDNTTVCWYHQRFNPQ
jgi:hypothetical protein